jgi:hypothetical protein
LVGGGGPDVAVLVGTPGVTGVFVAVGTPGVTGVFVAVGTPGVTGVFVGDGPEVGGPAIMSTNT